MPRKYLLLWFIGLLLIVLSTGQLLLLLWSIPVIVIGQLFYKFGNFMDKLRRKHVQFSK